MPSGSLLASELMTRICRDLEGVPVYIAETKKAYRAADRSSVAGIAALGKYNYETCTEILSRDCIIPDFPLDPAAVRTFEDAISRYLDTYAPGKPDLKRYVTAISLYLTFIAKKPLHPPDVAFSDEISITRDGNGYICTGKRRFIRDPGSLCRFCVCKTG